jgi:EAL domain-containing protein (putative c-di-GMP-specific phosphodiesterase class I)
MRLLSQLGCQAAQGYWFGKPMDRERVTVYLNNRAEVRMSS